MVKSETEGFRIIACVTGARREGGIGEIRRALERKGSALGGGGGGGGG